jgi:hypothetical protein
MNEKGWVTYVGSKPKERNLSTRHRDLKLFIGKEGLYEWDHMRRVPNSTFEWNSPQAKNNEFITD